METVLEFEFGDLFEVTFNHGGSITTPRFSIIGPQIHYRGQVRLLGNVESFAVFFQPFRFHATFRRALP